MPPAPSANFSFRIEDEEIDSLQHLLLERGQPLSTDELALALLVQRFEREDELANEQFRDCVVYDPARSYEIGERLLLLAEERQIGEIIGARAGENDSLGDFRVLTLRFADGEEREYAADLSVAHALSQAAEQLHFSESGAERAEKLFAERREQICAALKRRLSETGLLAHGGDAWFPHDLLIEIQPGTLQLMEAVLELAGGGPLAPVELLRRAGETANQENPLWVFSLNVALRADERFTEVGPAGQVLWYLERMLPEQARATHPLLRVAGSAAAGTMADLAADLSAEMRDCLRELDDEWSPFAAESQGAPLRITLTYPHRRAGSLPLNEGLRRLIPHSRVNQRIWMNFIDGVDGEEYPSWIFSEARYVLGLAPFYRKHLVPIGAYILVQPTDQPTQWTVDFIAYNERSENIRLAAPVGETLRFSEQRRPIGVAYDELMIFGIDDLAGLDRVAAASSRQPLPTLLRALAGALSALTPQGAIHFKTLYSAVNLLRRLPPLPICAALLSSDEFRSVGGNYWTLTR